MHVCTRTTAASAISSKAVAGPTATSVRPRRVLTVLLTPVLTVGAFIDV